MSLDDRDYMRERARQRIWNERKGRVELDPGRGGAWLESKNQGFDYQKRDKWQQRDRGPSTAWAGRGRKVRFKAHPMQGWVLLAAALGPLLMFYHDAKRAGWLPEWSDSAEIAFPESGSVTVNAAVDPRTATSKFRVTTADAHAVAQLYTITGEHILSLYVRKNDVVTTNVPPGRYRLKIAEGQRWFGPERFFGSSMAFETAVEDVELVRRKGWGIDLHRRPDGDLKTRPNIGSPTF